MNSRITLPSPQTRPSIVPNPTFGTAPLSAPAPVRTPAPQQGSLFERTIPTSKGPVGLLAEVEINGSTLHLKDVTIYGEGTVPLTGLIKEVLAGRAQLIKDVKAMGFEKLRITGERVKTSSSANPGHCIDVTIRVTE
jgi:hypothetical protein